MDRILVTGAGGFIGHHHVSRLKQEGHWVRGVDIKLPEFAASDADQFEILDLRRWDACLEATRGIDQVYSLAADMAGMGFISSNHSRILHNNALINLHAMHAAVLNGAGRYFYSSSACVCPEYLQLEENVIPLRKMTHSRRRRRTRTAGRSCSRSCSAATTQLTTVSRRGCSASTMSTGRSAHTREGVRRRPRRALQEGRPCGGRRRDRALG